MKLPSSKRLSLFSLWFFAFLFSSTVSFLFQLVILPYFLPQIHLGDGLLVNSDSAGYHLKGLDIVKLIAEQGWGKWDLFVSQHSVLHSLVGALYYLTVPKPWILIPFTAGFHALGFLLVACVLEKFISDRKVCVISALPFLLFPSTLTWVAQMNKDAFFSAGFLLCLYVWLEWMDVSVWSNARKLFITFCFYLVGGGLIWLSRGYQLAFLQGISILFSCVVLWRLFQTFRNETANKGMFLKAVAVCVFLSVLPSFVWYPKDIATGVPDSFITKGERATLDVEDIPDRKRATLVEDIPPYWYKTGFLPAVVEHKLHSLSKIRRGFLFKSWNSSLSKDIDTDFRSAWDILKYFPRAVQLGLLAPFPTDWFSSGKQSTSRLSRFFGSLEMVFSYCFLPFLILAIWNWKKDARFWMVFIYLAIPLLVQAYLLVNVGTLYRQRYPSFMLFLAFGMASFLLQLEKKRFRFPRFHFQEQRA